MLIGVLLLITLSACAGQQTKTTNNFEGKWESIDDKNNISTYTIYQRGNKACGFWYTYTVNQVPAAFEGSFKGIIEGNRLKITHGCWESIYTNDEKESTDTKLKCPADKNGEAMWDNPQDLTYPTLQLCGNELLATDSPQASCIDSNAVVLHKINNPRVMNTKLIDLDLNYPEDETPSSTGSQRILIQENIQENWLLNCLDKE